MTSVGIFTRLSSDVRNYHLIFSSLHSIRFSITRDLIGNLEVRITNKIINQSSNKVQLSSSGVTRIQIQNIIWIPDKSEGQGQEKQLPDTTGDGGSTGVSRKVTLDPCVL